MFLLLQFLHMFTSYQNKLLSYIFGHFHLGISKGLRRYPNPIITYSIQLFLKILMI